LLIDWTYPRARVDPSSYYEVGRGTVDIVMRFWIIRSEAWDVRALTAQGSLIAEPFRCCTYSDILIVKIFYTGKK
jgi:hypothetical protein